MNLFHFKITFAFKKIEREKFSVSMTGMVTSRMQLYAAIHFLLLTEGYRYMASNYEVV